jgi:probable F420-dependent oxidoreductase
MEPSPADTVADDRDLRGARRRLRETIGPIGAWSYALDGLSAEDEREAARAIERIGFPVLWFPEGEGSKEALSHAGHLLASTDRLVIATGIANMWARDGMSAANGARVLGEAYPGRFVLAIGAGHADSAEMRGATWRGPFERMVRYVEQIAEAPYGGIEPDPPVPLLLAALGPRMLALAGDRTVGAHTYFVPVEHTEVARAAVGANPVIAVEQTVVPIRDGARAKELARAWAGDYLELPNYANNLLRLGFTDEDVTPPGSDRVLEATIAWGSTDVIADRVRAHLAAGADHVCIQVVLDEASARVGIDELTDLFAALA